MEIREITQVDTKPYRSFVDRDPYAAAKELDLVCIEPEENQLFIDLDNEESQTYFSIRFGAFCLWHTCTAVYTRSKGGNVHVIITVTDEVYTPIERIALQAALGSDPVREMLSHLRLQKDTGYPPTCLFERNGAKQHTSMTSVLEEQME